MTSSPRGSFCLAQKDVCSKERGRKCQVGAGLQETGSVSAEHCWGLDLRSHTQCALWSHSRASYTGDVERALVSKQHSSISCGVTCHTYSGMGWPLDLEPYSYSMMKWRVLQKMALQIFLSLLFKFSWKSHKSFKCFLEFKKTRIYRFFKKWVKITHIYVPGQPNINVLMCIFPDFIYASSLLFW